MAHATRISTRRDTLLLAACILLSLVARGLPTRIRDPFAASMRQTIVAPFIALQHNSELTRRAWLARESTQAARDSVVLRAMSLPELERENDRLRRLLSLGSRLRWGFVPAEALFGRGHAEEYTVILSAGSRSGVKPFSPVVSAEGLVGMVKTVDPTLSLAIVWPHPDFRVSAQAADGSAFGIVATHLGDEPGRYLLEMRGVPLRSALKPGALIVSSGLGGVYPRGIPIGVVQKEQATTEVWARTYLLRPAVLPSDMSSVMILHPQRAAAGMAGVWPAVEAADAAAASPPPATAVAGDTLQKGARTASAPVRRSETDSAGLQARPAPVRRDASGRRDSVAVRRARAPRDTTRRDTIRQDTTPREIARPDTAGRDSVRRDTTVDTTGAQRP